MFIKSVLKLVKLFLKHYSFTKTNDFPTIKTSKTNNYGNKKNMKQFIYLLSCSKQQTNILKRYSCIIFDIKSQKIKNTSLICL